MRNKTIGYVCFKNTRSKILEKLTAQFDSGRGYTSAGLVLSREPFNSSLDKKFGVDLSQEKRTFFDPEKNLWDLILTLDSFLKNTVIGITKREEVFTVLELLAKYDSEVKEKIKARPKTYLGIFDLDDTNFTASHIVARATGRKISAEYVPFFYNKGLPIPFDSSEKYEAEKYDLVQLAKRVPSVLNQYFGETK